MDKKQSLEILIKNTTFLTDYLKEKFIKELDTITHEEMELLGKFLSLHMKQTLSPQTPPES